MCFYEPIVLTYWLTIDASDEAHLMKAHARDPVESLASRWRVVPRQGGEDYPANVSADDLVAV